MKSCSKWHDIGLRAMRDVSGSNEKRMAFDAPHFRRYPIVYIDSRVGDCLASCGRIDVDFPRVEWTGLLLLEARECWPNGTDDVADAGCEWITLRDIYFTVSIP